MRLSRFSTFTLAAVAALSMLTIAPSASADTYVPPPTAPGYTVRESKVSSYDATTCAEIQKQDPSNNCQLVTDLALGPVESSTGQVESSSASQADFSASDMQSLEEAGAINCRNWSMQRRPRDGSGLWQISQRGRHCWDGSLAWYGTYRGVAGYHECGYADYGIFSVRSRSCTRSGNQTSQLRNSYAVTFQIPRTTIYSTFTLAYTGGRSGTYSTSGL